jgi:hypothetical protein
VLLAPDDLGGALFRCGCANRFHHQPASFP